MLYVLYIQHSEKNTQCSYFVVFDFDLVLVEFESTRNYGFFYKL